jgi:REP element-mobilizing transposase RayT
VKRRHSRLQVPGSTNFVTTTIVDFSPIFRNEALAKIVLDNIRIYSQKCHIQIHGFVIMPNHLHLLLTVGHEGSVSQFMGRMKEYSAKEIVNWCLNNKETSLLAVFSTVANESKLGHQYQVWQKRFDHVVIIREDDLLIKLNYIHNNPLQERWNLCEKVEDYRFSSAKYYFKGEDVGIPIVKIA